jgi:hypothetical protein
VKRVLVALFVVMAVVWGTSRTAHAQAAPPPVARTAFLEWDIDRRLLYLDMTFRDLVDAGIQNKLSRGFPTTIVLTATIQREGSTEVLSTTTQTCRITWHVWEEAYHVEIVRPGSTRVSWTTTIEGVLKRCAETRRLLAGDATQIPLGVPLYVRGSIQVNPVSPEVLSKLRRWVMRPSSTGTAVPGDALFSTFTGLFMQRIGDAERDQKFFTRPAEPTRFSSKAEEKKSG